MKMMPIDGSVWASYYFSPDFKEYIQKEHLNCCLPCPHYFNFVWVFWNQQDHQTQLDNYADLIRHALQKLISKYEIDCHLVQFWAPTKTSEGRTLLTTQFQPFALGPANGTDDRSSLCEYRMGMCRKYNNSFYADAECPQEQLGVPGRVFLHQSPESTPDVKHYTLKEYPQRDLAIRCGIESSWAVPVFDHSSHACVGVLEFVSVLHPLWYDEHFRGQIYDIFQEFGLQCFDGYKHYEMQIGDVNKAHTTAFEELETVLETVCKIHKLPLAMTWVPCSTCDALLGKQFLSKGIEFYDREKCFGLVAFRIVSKFNHLRTGLVARMVRSSSNILYCSDITQLSLAEYPLVPYARKCKLRGWFTICLQSSYTANDVYVLELFLPTSERYCDSSWTLLSKILETMEKFFISFKLASVKELGDVLSVEVMDFQNGQKNHYVQNIQAIRFSSDPELVKPASRYDDIHHGSPCDTDMVGSSRPLPGEDQEQNPSLNSDRWSDKSTARICNMVTIKAKLQNYYTIKFSLLSSARFVELQQQVAKRLDNLEAGTYHVFYEDEENDRILIACDEDLKEFLRTPRSLGKTTVVVHLVPNQSITNLDDPNYSF